MSENTSGQGLKVSTENCQHGIPMADICQECVTLSMRPINVFATLRNNALEEAARMCEMRSSFNSSRQMAREADYCASAIRALKT